MENIQDIQIQPIQNSKFIQPFKMLYKQDGQQKYWDCMRSHDSIAVLVYNKTQDTLVLVKQFRPAVYMAKNSRVVETSSVFSESLRMKSSLDSSTQTNSPAQEGEIDSTQFGPASEGMTYELCAGIVDKHASLEQIAKEELLEETGYDVPLESIQQVTGYQSSIGTSGSYQTMFYCEVTDDMQRGEGGGMAHEGEMIEVVHIPASNAVQFALDPSNSRSSGLCFGFLWFDKTIRPNLTQDTKP